MEILLTDDGKNTVSVSQTSTCWKRGSVFVNAVEFESFILKLELVVKCNLVSWTWRVDKRFANTSVQQQFIHDMSLIAYSPLNKRDSPGDGLERELKLSECKASHRCKGQHLKCVTVPVLRGMCCIQLIS